MSSNIRRIGVYSSGGDAPGMNSAIRAVIRTAIYNEVEVCGIYRGYEGMIDGEIQVMTKGDVANIIHRGGTILKTARSERFRTKEGRLQAFESLKRFKIDALVAVGGDGTFTGAHIFQDEYSVPVIGVPGTIDNDLAGTDYTIGFDTAVNTAIEAVDRIRDTADSHNRLFFVEVMGRHTGFIALNTGIGSGAGGIMIPESLSDLDALRDRLVAMKKRNKLFSVVIVAEGNENGNAQHLANMVSEKFDGFETKVTIIGHLQRGGAPTAFDRLISSRMGFAAVEGLLAGKTDVMAGMLNNEIIFTPLAEAIGGKKTIDPELIRLAEILSL